MTHSKLDTMWDPLYLLFRKISKYRTKSDNLIISKPYYDWGGAGEITTIGKPFFHDDKLVGVVSLDYTLKGIGNTPRDNSIFFNDGFKSYIVIIEYGDDFEENPGEGFVISHPLKQTENQSTLEGSTISQVGFQIYTSPNTFSVYESYRIILYD